MDITQLMSESHFGQGSHAEMADLHKALEILNTTGMQTVNSLDQSGAPLKAESLDAMIRTLTYDKSFFTIYNDIPKNPVYNNVNQRVNRVSHGDLEGGFVGEGQVGAENDVVFERKISQVKYLVEMRRVSHQATLVNTIPGVANLLTEQVEGGIMTIMARANKNIVTANSANVSDEWDGIYAQHQMDTTTGVMKTPEAYYTDTNLVVDMLGLPLSEVALRNATAKLVDVYGTADSLYAPPSVIEGYVNQYLAQNRNLTPVAAGTTLGLDVSAVRTQYGVVNLKYDTFMNPRAPKTSASGSTSESAPPQPIVGGTPVAIAASDTSSKFLTGDAGTYLYMVTAYNAYGESAPTLLDASAVSVVATDAVTLSFSQGTPIAGRPTSAYRIYRTVKNGTGTFHLLFEVSAAQLAAGYDGAAAGYVRDRNRIRANTKQAFLIQNHTRVWNFDMMSPISKMNLAQVAMYLPVAVFLYANPVLNQAKKMIRFINIGQ